MISCVFFFSACLVVLLVRFPVFGVAWCHFWDFPSCQIACLELATVAGATIMTIITIA